MITKFYGLSAKTSSLKGVHRTAFELPSLCCSLLVLDDERQPDVGISPENVCDNSLDFHRGVSIVKRPGRVMRTHACGKD
jgi:hypothetical protein